MEKYTTLHNFIVFEGIDGAGTSTQIQILKKELDTTEYFFTAEPSESETGQFLRRMLKGEIAHDPKTAAYLFAADRNEHLYGTGHGCGIVQKCAAGTKVVSDRYIFSSLAYQSVTCGLELPRALNSAFPLPEILFFFEIEPETSLERIGRRAFREIYEQIDFLKQTESQYRSVISEYEKQNTGMKIVRIDAAMPIPDVTAELKKWLPA